MSRVIDEHRLYLRDRARVSAYARALAEVVRPGDVVVDLASGTGILGMLACRAGAARVYAIEGDTIAGLARSIARANGLADRIVGVRGHSMHVSLPERADLLVSDQIGRFGLEAEIIDLFRDARARLLRPNARLVPSTIRLIVAPIEDASLHRRVTFWRHRPAGFDFSPAATIAANTGYPARFRPEQLLASPNQAGLVDLAADVPLPIRCVATFSTTRDGVLHGVGGWFEAQLSPSVTLTNSPLSDDRIYRRQIFFPLAEGVPIVVGDSITVAIRMLPSQLIYVWEVGVRPSTGPARRFRHSTLEGMLLAPEDLRCTDPNRRPRLTPRGVARSTVLSLCDGHRTVREIEDGVLERHPELCATRDDAATFVAEVLTRYATDGV